MSRLKKMIMTVGAVCIMSLAAYGCGTASGTEMQVISGDEADGQQEIQENETDVSLGEEGQTETLPEEKDNLEELAGDVQEIGEGKFIVAEIYQETLEDDAEIMVAVAPGNEENANLITVIYDDDTVFYKRTIRNGGADYEDSAASADDLAKGLTAEMKGNYESEGFHAAEIKLVEVIN